MVKAGAPRPAVIPKYKSIKEDIVLWVIKTVGLTKKELLARLNKGKKQT